MRVALILLMTFSLTWLILDALFSNLENHFTSAPTAPFNTVVSYFCSKNGSEYVITHTGAIAPHLGGDGLPVSCPEGPGDF